MGIVATVYGKDYEPGQPSVRPRPNPKRGQENRIVGGVEAKPHSFPWMARLIWIDPPTAVPRLIHFCDGSLLPVGSKQQSDLILTAGHCVEDKQPSIAVRLGSHDILNPPKTQVIIDSTQYVIHKDFLDAKTFVLNDIAIIKLKKPVNFTDTIQPIRLPAQTDVVPDGTVLTAAGWGAASVDGNQSTILMQVGLAKESDTSCNKGLEGAYDAKQMFCAGTQKLAACPGDSGGPVMFNNTNVYTLEGIVSWGGCNRPGYPAAGVFTRVTTYLPWINQQIQALSAFAEVTKP